MGRGKGEGSIYRRADGYYVGSIEAGRTPEGKRRRLRVVRKRRADVVNALDELRRNVTGGTVPDRAVTVGEYLDWFIDNVIATSGVSERTVGEHHKRVKRLRRYTDICDIKLHRLTKTHVQTAANQLAEQYPHTPRTRSTTLETLYRALRWAVPELIPRNPAEGVKGPKTPVATVDDTLEADEAKAVLAAAEGDDLYALGWLALNYGLRIGELVALRWADITNDEMTVRRTDTKTDAGYRTMPLIEEAKRVLDAHRRGQTVLSPYVFSGPTGARLRERIVRERWNGWLLVAGVQHLCRWCPYEDVACWSTVRRFHSSRHTAATLLLEKGVPLEVVSAILGHANIGITASVYAKVRADLLRRGLRALDR